MSTLTYTHTLVAGTPENVNHVQQNFVDARTVINGGLDTNNLSASAGIVDTQLASPNNSVYRTLLHAGGRIAGGATLGTYLINEGASVVADGGNQTAPVSFYFDDADYAVGGKTQKLRVRMQVYSNATAPAVNFTSSLRTFTVAGGASVITYALGGQVTGSDVAINAPSASSVNQVSSSDFNVPADGHYVLAVGLSGTVAANNISVVRIQLQTRNT